MWVKAREPRAEVGQDDNLLLHFGQSQHGKNIEHRRDQRNDQEAEALIKKGRYQIAKGAPDREADQV